MTHLLSLLMCFCFVSLAFCDHNSVKQSCTCSMSNYTRVPRWTTCSLEPRSFNQPSCFGIVDVAVCENALLENKVTVPDVDYPMDSSLFSYDPTSRFLCFREPRSTVGVFGHQVEVTMFNKRDWEVIASLSCLYNFISSEESETLCCQQLKEDDFEHFSELKGFEVVDNYLPALKHGQPRRLSMMDIRVSQLKKIHFDRAKITPGSKGRCNFTFTEVSPKNKTRTEVERHISINWQPYIVVAVTVFAVLLIIGFIGLVCYCRQDSVVAKCPRVFGIQIGDFLDRKNQPSDEYEDEQV